ncbi:hypothetical protein O181_020840 [Austropuccinia psidii MF-1]|uniref:Uncharacterized protein n=1 Tax=Austropuccinia psidii MF-1 TaxID=1389203 RepID=A0A9Q3CEJ3_9BASI|nr:hypothetical protein [Austropuccinia psidii MF-1]
MILFLDWDKTITSSDTTHLICSSFSYNLNNPEDQEKKLSNQVKYLNYRRIYEHFLIKQEKKLNQIKDLNNELNDYLKSFEKIEELIRSLIKSDKFFDSANFLINLNSNLVKFQIGWNEFVNWIKKIKNNQDSQIESNLIEEVHIISCSWSENFIRSSLSDDFLSSLTSIRANEIQIDRSQIIKSPNCQEPNGIRTGIDKLNEINRILSQDQPKQQDKTHPSSVYIGDSETDLACFLNVEIPIVFGPKPRKNPNHSHCNLERPMITLTQERLNCLAGCRSEDSGTSTKRILPHFCLIILLSKPRKLMAAIPFFFNA